MRRGDHRLGRLRVVLVVQCARRNRAREERRSHRGDRHGPLHLKRRGHVKARRNSQLPLRRAATPAGQPHARDIAGARDSGSAGSLTNPARQRLASRRAWGLASGACGQGRSPLEALTDYRKPVSHVCGGGLFRCQRTLALGLRAGRLYPEPVTLRPQPKGLGRCAGSIGGMASYFCARATLPHPRFFACAQNDIFHTNEISQSIVRSSYLHFKTRRLGNPEGLTPLAGLGEPALRLSKGRAPKEQKTSRAGG